MNNTALNAASRLRAEGERSLLLAAIADWLASAKLGDAIPDHFDPAYVEDALREIGAQGVYVARGPSLPLRLSTDPFQGKDST